MFLVYLGLAWMGGIWLAAFWGGVPAGLWVGGAIFGIGAAILLRKRPGFPLIMACFAALCLGALRFQLAYRFRRRLPIFGRNAFLRLVPIHAGSMP